MNLSLRTKAYTHLAASYEYKMHFNLFDHWLLNVDDIDDKSIERRRFHFAYIRKIINKLFIIFSNGILYIKYIYLYHHIRYDRWFINSVALLKRYSSCIAPIFTQTSHFARSQSCIYKVQNNTPHKLTIICDMFLKKRSLWQ